MAMNPIIAQMIGYAGSMVIVVAIMAWFLKGFLGPFFKVKTSRGKLTLVRIRGKVRNYWRSGKVSGNALQFKNGEKQVCTVTNITPVDFEDLFGVKVIYIDESTGAVVNGEIPRTSTIKSGHDPVQTEQLIQRALTRPFEGDKIFKIIIILLVVLILVGLFNAFMTYQIGPKLQVLLEAIKTMKTTI